MIKHLLRVSLLVASTLLPATCWAQSASQPAQTGTSLGDIARKYREGKAAGAVPEGMNDFSSKTTTAALASTDPTQQYADHVEELLRQRDFKQLDVLAEEARSAKSRFAGGGWKLFALYRVLNRPRGGSSIGDSGWRAHINRLIDWAKAEPSSITAPVAAADAMLNYAWEQRGGGYADSVSEDGWQNFAPLSAAAHGVLVKAAKAPQRCPHWYYVMERVAIAEGWDKDQERALFSEAMTREPGYYYVHQMHVQYLLPKWYGDDGEAEAALAQVSKHVGGKEGAFLYFVVATHMHCGCGSDIEQIARLSWPKIQEGYAAMKQLYGTDNMRENQYAYLAYLAGDHAAAKGAFAKVADWDESVWRKRQTFDTAKSWAAN